jgi:hypothetical protein
LEGSDQEICVINALFPFVAACVHNSERVHCYAVEHLLPPSAVAKSSMKLIVVVGGKKS